MPSKKYETKRTLSWPEHHRECTKCKEIKHSDYFSPFKGGAKGLYPVCKECRVLEERYKWSNTPRKNKILARAKRRSKEKGYECNLTLADIPELPEKCPVFGVLMVGKYSPSLDRIDSTKGYIKGNIQIISNRANTIKNNATPKELRQLADYMSEVVTVGRITE